MTWVFETRVVWSEFVVIKFHSNSACLSST